MEMSRTVLDAVVEDGTEKQKTRRKRKASVEKASKAVETVLDAGTGKKRTNRKRKARKEPRRELNWRNVTPASDSLSLLVGSQEGGFLSLEEIDGDSWLQISGLEGAEVLGTPAASLNPSSNRKRRKKINAAAAHEKPVVTASALEALPETSGEVPESRSRKKRKENGFPDRQKVSIVRADESVLPIRNAARLPESDHDHQTEEYSGLPIVRHPGKVEVTKTLEQLKKKKKKKNLVSSPKQSLHISEQNSSKLNDGSSAVSGSGEQSSQQTDGTLKGKRNAKEKKPKLGSRRRKLLRGQKSSETNVPKLVHKNEPAEVPVEVHAAGSDDEEFDVSAWAEMRLHSKLEKAICTLKFKQPTPIQRQCIPAAAHKGKDVIGAAETGSGKTLAFALPILQRLLEEQDKAAAKQMISEDPELQAEDNSTSGRKQGYMRALIITPTRELAMQICEHLKAAAKWTNIRVVPVVGGMATQKQQRLLKQRPEIVVGTPGRLWELMSAGETHLLELYCLSFFVLDEADRMVEKGHFKELQSIIDMLQTAKETNANSWKDGAVAGRPDDASCGGDADPPKSGKRRQTLVFSATLALPGEFKSKLKRGQMLPKVALKSIDSVAALSARAGVRQDAAIVDLTSSMVVAEKLTESCVECRDEEKDEYLYYILKVHGGERTIVFFTSIAALRRATAILRLLQISVCPLHAQMQQKARLKAIDQFRTNKDCVLLATDVAARGLDIPGIRTVVHYQLPHSAEIYVHRSGRTARGSSGGISIAFVSPSDQGKYLTLCRALSRPDGLQPFPVNMMYLPAMQNRVSLALKVDKLMRKQSLSKATDTWLARNAEAMEIDLEVSEDEDGGSGNGGGKSKGAGFSELRSLQKELHLMLSQPVKPKAFSNRYVTGSGMTPLVTKQLQNYCMLNTKPGISGGHAMSEKQIVIGQEQMEPLDVMQLSAPTRVKRRR